MNSNKTVQGRYIIKANQTLNNLKLPSDVDKVASNATLEFLKAEPAVLVDVHLLVPLLHLSHYVIYLKWTHVFHSKIAHL